MKYVRIFWSSFKTSFKKHWNLVHGFNVVLCALAAMGAIGQRIENPWISFICTLALYLILLSCQRKIIKLFYERGQSEVLKTFVTDDATPLLQAMRAEMQELQNLVVTYRALVEKERGSHPVQ